MIPITIGRNEQNDVKYTHPSVSGNHAKAMVSDEVIELIDLQSTNGTFVNGIRISKSAVGTDDHLQFGECEVSMTRFLEQIRKIYLAKKTDYSKEFRKVLGLFSKYQSAKDKIVNPPQWPLYARIVLTVVAMLVLIFTHIIPTKYTIYVMMSVGLFSMIPSLFAPSPAKKNDLLDQLKLDYEDRLVCPKCQYKLIYQNLAYWRGKSRCVNDKCTALYKKLG